MSYATIDEIKSMFRDWNDTVEPAVTDAEITAYLGLSTSIIDAKIGTLYTLPITSGDNPQSYNILKQIQKYMGACEFDEILNSYGEADKKPTWCKKAMELMTALVPPINPKTCKQCEPTMKLPDAPYLGTATKKNTISIKATSGRIFTKGGDNW